MSVNFISRARLVDRVSTDAKYLYGVDAKNRTVAVPFTGAAGVPAAIGDGVTDDTLALQAALDAGGEISLPAGTFMVTSLTVATSVRLMGAGTIKQIASTAADMITISGTSTRVHFSGITLDGNQANQAALSRYATVKITGYGTSSEASVFEFDNVTFKNGVWADLTIRNDDNQTSVDKLRISGCKFFGGREGTTQADDTRYIDIRSPVDYIITGCVFDLLATPSQYGRAGVLAYDGHSTIYESARGVVSGNHLHNIGRSQTNSILGAIDLYSRGRTTAIVGNTLVDPVGRGIQTKADSAGVNITGNTIDGLIGGSDGAMNAQITVNASTNTSVGGSALICGNTLVDSGKDAISVTQSNSDDSAFSNGLLIHGNTIRNATRRGIGVVDVYSCSVVANSIDDGSGAGIYVQDAEGPILISSNSIRSVSGVGVQIPSSNGAASFSINANHIEATGGRGIYVSSGIRGQINDNTILGTGAAAIEVTGTTGPWSVEGNVSDVSPAFTDGGTNSQLYVGRNNFENALTTTAHEVTIAAGVITVTMDYHWVDTEGDAASDDLTTINGGWDGMLLTLRARDDARTVVVKDGTQLRLAGDMSLNSLQDTITLRWIASEGVWLEVARSDNGA